MIVALLLNAFAVWFVVGAARSLVRARQKHRERKDGELVVSSMAGMAMGARCLGLQAIVQPEARHAVVEILEEQSLEDGSGGEPPGGRAFHEALRRVRRGEDVGELAVRAESPAGQEETRSS